LQSGSLQVEAIVTQAAQELTRRQVLLNVQAPNLDESRSPQRPAPTPANGPEFPSPAPRATANKNTSGKLSLSLRSNTGAMRVGQQSTFFLEITNGRNTAEDEVVLEVTIPDGMSFSDFSRPRSELTFAPDGRSFKLAAIRTLRAKEQPSPYRLTLTADKAGQFELVASVSSRQTRTPDSANAIIVVQP
jgi:hypothetical protein